MVISYTVGEQCIRQYKVEYLYHMTSISNLSSIVEIGLLSHNQAHRLLTLTDISDCDVQSLRSQRIINSRPLHDYACLYFSPRNPMLYVRREQQKDIAILGINPYLLLDNNTIFSDGNAAAINTKFYQGASKLNQLSWNIINAPYWNEFADGKRIKCSEVLVYPKVCVKNILKIFCYSNTQFSLCYAAMLGKVNVPVEVNRGLYF